MKYYIISGERSGDLHGSNLVKALKNEDTGAEIRGWGGSLMQVAGADIVVNYASLAFMGFWEVAKNLGTIRKYLKFCKQDILAYKPDVLILIDYAGFNLRIAKFAKKNNIRVFYYISPKVWAWKQSRALKIKASVDKMFVILPFEKSFYDKYDYKVDYVGNPLLDSVREFQANERFLSENHLGGKPIIAILPGSRRQEIENILATMLGIASQFPDHQFIIAGVDNLPREFYGSVVGKENIEIIFNQTYDLLANAQAALVTSGTATLETALFEVPQVVCYKTSKISYLIAKALIKVKYISLVNLVAEKEVVKELIQDDLNPVKLAEELRKILAGAGRAQQLEAYKKIKRALGNKKTSENLARLIVGYLRE